VAPGTARFGGPSAFPAADGAARPFRPAAAWAAVRAPRPAPALARRPGRAGQAGQGLAHRGEAAPVLRAGAVALQCGQVRRGRVALVHVEAVLGVLLVQPGHQPVAADLGQDRGGHDRALQAVAADQGLGHAGQAAWNHVAVDAGQLHRRLQGADGPAHALQGGLQDVEPVDFLHRHHLHVPGQGALEDARVQGLALGGGELLGVVQAADAACGIQHHRGHRHRAGQRAAPGFVHAAHAQLAAVHREQPGADVAGPAAPAHRRASARPGRDAIASAARAEASWRSCRCRSR